MWFDKGTISVDVLMVTALLAFGSFCLAAIQSILVRRFSGHIALAIRFCAYSFTAAGIGNLLILFRPVLPATISRTLSHTLILAGIIGFYIAVKTLKQEKVNLPYWLTIIFANLGLFSWFYFIEPNLSARLIVLNLCTIAVLIPLFFNLIFKAPSNHRIIWQITGLLFGVILAMLMVRTTHLAINYASYLPISDGTLLPAVFFKSSYLVTLLGGLFFMLVASAEAAGQLSQLAILDPLTGIYNGRGFEEVAGKALRVSERTGRTNALLILDLDHFKSINDRFGHSEGDRVLKKTAEALASQLRAEDILGRYGGEEFVVLLPNAMAENAKQIAERLRQAVQGLAHRPDQPSLRMTVSIGLATDEGKQQEGLTRLFEEADKALYQAKTQGRNRTVAAVI